MFFDFAGLSSRFARRFILVVIGMVALATHAQIPPPAPTGLTVTSSSEAGVSLSWTPPADDGQGAIDAYNVFRCVEDASPCTPEWYVWLEGGAITAFTDTGVSAGATYRYTVQAIRYEQITTGPWPEHQSPWSNQVTATAGNSAPSPPPQPPTTPPPAMTPPAAPTGLTVTSSSEAGVSLSWTPPADDGQGAIDAYNVFRCVEDASPCTPEWYVWLEGGAITAFTDTGVSAGATYRYTVQAIRYEQITTGPWPEHQSPWSNQVTATAGNSAPSPPPPDGDELVWSDEFNAGITPTSANWDYEHGFVRNEELQWYSQNNASVENGRLVIDGRRESVKNPEYDPGSSDWRKTREYASYTSASLYTKLYFQYGIFKIRAKIRAENGLWPAIWFLGDLGEWPANGEIDLMEYYAGKIHANAAWSSGVRWRAVWDAASVSVAELGGEAWDDDFHIWTMDWNSERIHLYVDDRLLNTVDLTQTLNPEGVDGPENPFHQPHRLLLNLAIGGTSGGDPSGTAFPSAYEIDYVRVYDSTSKRQEAPEYPEEDTLPDTPAPTVALAPAPPTGLTVTTINRTGISLGWTLPADDGAGAIDAYNVFRCVEHASPCTPEWYVWLEGGAITTFTDTQVSAGTTYRYTVQAIRYEKVATGPWPEHQSVWSNQVTAAAGTSSSPPTPTPTETPSGTLGGAVSPLALSGSVVVEDTPGQLMDDPLAQPDYLWHYGSASPAFTLDDTAGFGILSAGDTVTLSGSMTLTGNNHRDHWDDRLVLAVGTGNGPAADNHPYAGSFGYSGGNSKVYAFAVSMSPLGGFADDNSRPPLEVIDALGTREVATTATRRSPTVVWELSITLAGTWKDYSTGDNTEQDNGRGIERHQHSYTLSLDLDYDGTFETTVTGTFKTYQAESIGIGFAVEQADARYFKPDPDNPSGPWIVDPDLNTWGAAARTVNDWTLFNQDAISDAANLYPNEPVYYTLNYDLTETGHKISSMLFGTNIEHFDTGDSYWDSYGENSELIRLMKERPVTWIRFPGGEPTSMYHFNLASATMSTTARWGVDEWDTSKRAAERTLAPDSDYVDFDEFSLIVKHTDAIPFVGINMESAYYFRALELDKQLLDPTYSPSLTRDNFNTNYSYWHILDGITQAIDVALYMDEIGLGVRHWYLDNESNLANYSAEFGGMWAGHYARMARDYIWAVDAATRRTDNAFIANWNNIGFVKDTGWKHILDAIGHRLGYIDFHTYWWVDGGSWRSNDAVNPHTDVPNPEYGVSTWDVWKSQLPMQWENIDNDSHDYYNGQPLRVHIGSALTDKTSLAEYFSEVRRILDDNNFGDIKIMIGEWGVAPRGHWRLDPTRYQITVMLAEYFMQMIASGAIEAVANWPFSSTGGPFLDNRHNVLHKPDGTNEILAPYEMQKLFRSFIGAGYLPVDTGQTDLIAIGAYHADKPSVHIAVLNKSGQEISLRVPTEKGFNTAQISRMQPLDDPGEYDDTYGAGKPVFDIGNASRLEFDEDTTITREVIVTVKPWSLAWVNLSSHSMGE